MPCAPLYCHEYGSASAFAQNLQQLLCIYSRQAASMLWRLVRP